MQFYGELFESIKNFVTDRIELPEKDNWIIITPWIFATYLVERFSCFLILYFYGNKSCGKTKAGEVIISLANRGIRCTLNTPASTQREIHFFRPTMQLDEGTLFKAGADPSMTNLIKKTCEREGRVARCDDKSMDAGSLNCFRPYCPLLLTNETFAITKQGYFTITITLHNISTGRGLWLIDKYLKRIQKRIQPDKDQFSYQIIKIYFYSKF